MIKSIILPIGMIKIDSHNMVMTRITGGTDIMCHQAFKKFAISHNYDYIDLVY